MAFWRSYGDIRTQFRSFQFPNSRPGALGAEPPIQMFFVCWHTERFCMAPDSTGRGVIQVVPNVEVEWIFPLRI